MPFLYHATDKKNLESIVLGGLLVNPPKHAFAKEIGVNALSGKVFLALSADAAIAYAECADECPEEITIFKIPYETLNEEFFDYDWNNRCEHFSDINSCVYKSNIPAEVLFKCDPNNEPYQNVEDFKGTFLFEKILDVFDEYIATGTTAHARDFSRVRLHIYLNNGAFLTKHTFGV